MPPSARGAPRQRTSLNPSSVCWKLSARAPGQTTEASRACQDLTRCVDWLESTGLAHGDRYRPPARRSLRGRAGTEGYTRQWVRSRTLGGIQMGTGEHERWKEHYRRTPERDVDFETLSGEPIEPLYTPADVAGIDHDRDLGYPGHYPFTRGVYHSMYRGRLWTMRQFAGFGSAEETNRRYKFLLKQGQGGLSVAFDMPTLMGRDSDDPRSEGEVGRCGVATDSLADFETLFDGIPLGDITTSMTISGPATVLFAFFLATAEKQGVPWNVLDGTLQTDILKEYIAQKEWIFPPRPHLRLIGDLIEFCASEVPKWHPISVSGDHIPEAGSTAAQELAFTLADGVSYVGLGPDPGLRLGPFC